MVGGIENNLIILFLLIFFVNDWVFRLLIIVLLIKINIGKVILMVMFVGRVMGIYFLCKGNNILLWVGDIIKNVLIVVVFVLELFLFLVLNFGNGVVDEGLFLKKLVNGEDILDKF